MVLPTKEVVGYHILNHFFGNLPVEMLMVLIKEAVLMVGTAARLIITDKKFY